MRDLNSILIPDVKVTFEDGIFIDTQWQAAGVSNQFLDEAQSYHEMYSVRQDFEVLIQRMLRSANVNLDAPLSVLDIGSGGGSSVFATLKALKKSDVCASDISPQLLKILMTFANSQDELCHRIKSVCFDLHKAFFLPNSFDLIIGCAMLHHIQDPFQALTNVFSALRPGGKMILNEPFEAGNLVNLFIYDSVIDLAKSSVQPSDLRLIQLMNAMRTDLQARQGPPIEKPWTKHLDDKWIFNLAYLKDLGDQLGSVHTEIVPEYEDLTHLYEESFMSLLQVSGNADIVLSKNVIQFLQNLDEDIAPRLKKNLCPSGIIVFTKSA
jgi:SAM-dependent methyltransferase